MEFEVELINWNELWEVTGPFWITAIAIIVIGLLGSILVKVTPRGFFRDTVKIIVPVCIIGGAVLVLYLTSQVWGS